MRNTPIEGGRIVGPPPSWDVEAQGECLDLHVLQVAPPYPGMASTYTAWQFDQDQLRALEEGGHFVLGVVLPYVPVLRLLVQDRDGKPVGELEASRNGVVPIAPPTVRADYERMREVAAALRAAVIAIGRNLEEIVAGPPQDQDWQGADNAAIVQRLAELVERVGYRFDVQRIPLLTLEDLVRGEAGKGKPFPGEPVDPGVQAELERRLGVELNPPTRSDSDGDDGA